MSFYKSPMRSICSVPQTPLLTVGFGFVQVGMNLFRKIRLAYGPTTEHGTDNTRAVPLVRKDDAHQGRVSFLPKCEGSLGGAAS